MLWINICIETIIWGIKFSMTKCFNQNVPGVMLKFTELKLGTLLI